MIIFVRVLTKEGSILFLTVLILEAVVVESEGLSGRTVVTQSVVRGYFAVPYLRSCTVLPDSIDDIMC